MTFFKEVGRPLLVMIILVGIVFILKSPVFTWLTPPTQISGDYYLTMDDSEFSEYGLVTKVSDGDTFTLNEDKEVRMLGMDTPELAHPEFYIKEECFGKDAKARLEQLILNRYVLLLKDKEDKDKYERSLRFVFLPDKDNAQKKMLVNAYMVGEGFARAYIFKQDEKYKDLINSLQRRAVKEKRGLWGNCDREKFRW